MAEFSVNEKEKPVIIVIDGPLKGQQWVLERDELTIGRGGDCDVVIPERRISREHLVISRQGDRYFVTDLDSKNGTHVNAERLEGSRELTEGDEIQIALAVKLKFIGSDATVPLTLDDLESPQTGLYLDRHTREVSIRGELLDPPLSLYQYRLLELMFGRNGGVVTRDDVVHAVWPDADEEGVSEQAIDALVRRLRDRLAELDPKHQYVVTVRGHGFRFEQTGAE